MLTYEQWDVVADTYIPSLAVIFIAQMVCTLYQRHFVKVAEQCVLTVLFVAAVYLIGYIDKITHTWPRLGLDYSTHTALAFVLVVAISKQLPPKYAHLRYALAISFMVYLLLMNWMNYHTPADMVTTFITLLICTLLLNYGAQRFSKCYRTQIF